MTLSYQILRDRQFFLLIFLRCWFDSFSNIFSWRPIMVRFQAVCDFWWRKLTSSSRFLWPFWWKNAVENPWDCSGIAAENALFCHGFRTSLCSISWVSNYRVMFFRGNRGRLRQSIWKNEQAICRNKGKSWIITELTKSTSPNGSLVRV